MQPAVLNDFSGSIRALPVAQHHLWPFHAQLPRLSRRNFIIVIIHQLRFGGRHWQANTAAVIVDIVRIDAHQRRALRQAIAFQKILPGQLNPALRNDLLYRHSAAGGEMQ